MATLRKDGRWTCGKRMNGKLIFGYGKTPAEAEENLADKLTRWTRPTGNITTLHDVAKSLWYPQIQHLAPTSKTKYEGVYKNHIRDSIGHLAPSELGFAELQGWINNLKTGDATKRFARDVIGQILKLAEQAGLIEKNPVQFVKAAVKGSGGQLQLPLAGEEAA